MAIWSTTQGHVVLSIGCSSLFGFCTREKSDSLGSVIPPFHHFYGSLRMRRKLNEGLDFCSSTWVPSLTLVYGNPNSPLIVYRAQH